MGIKKLQEDVCELMKVVNSKHGFPYPNIMSILKLYEELGELTQLIIESTVKTRKGDVLKIEEVREDIGDELADISIIIAGLANDYDVDLVKHIEKKMLKHKDRWDNV